MKTIHLTQKEFIEKVADYQKGEKPWKYLGDKPAIVDFYASWCGPCRSIAPILEELAGEYADQLYIYKVDTDAEKRLAALFEIRSIPTLLFIPMEGKPHIARGAMPKEKFREVIKEVLLGGK